MERKEFMNVIRNGSENEFDTLEFERGIYCYACAKLFNILLFYSKWDQYLQSHEIHTFSNLHTIKKLEKYILNIFKKVSSNIKHDEDTVYERLMCYVMRYAGEIPEDDRITDEDGIMVMLGNTDNY